MSTAEGIAVRPARNVAEAQERFHALAERDDARIMPAARSRLFSSGERTPLAVVLLHGFTNAPEQWVPFATDLFNRGHSVVIPRLPGHGDVDRRGVALARFRARDFLRTASEATDIATGLGERVVVAGLSVGGTISAWLGQHRPDVARSVPIVPLIGVAKLGIRGNRVLARALAIAPNVFMPWDPRAGADAPESPPYAYPDFPTRTLGEFLRIGSAVYRTSATRQPAGKTRVILNANEPACNNALATAVAAGFARGRAGACDVTVMQGLPVNHDVIDPNNPQARIDVVYPIVRDAIER